MTEETKPQPKQQTCAACGAIFIGDNFHSIKYVNVSSGPAIAIEKFKLQICSKNSNPKCLTKSLVNRTVFTKRPSYNAGFLTPSQHDDIAVQLIKEMGLTMPDRFITIKWIDGARKVPVSVDSKYFCKVLINGFLLSSIIEFNDSTNEGYLTFVSPELIQGINLDGLQFDIYEASTKVAIGRFK
jgi:hypothetical protein